MKSPEELRVRNFLSNVDPYNGKHQEEVWRALQFLYKRQTEEEKVIEATHVDNGVGFSGFDAPFLTSVAKSSIPYRTLTPKQTAVVAKKLIRYSRQLSEMVKGDVQTPVPVTSAVKVKGKGFECDLGQFTRTSDRLVAEASDLQFPAGKWPRSIILKGVGAPLEYTFDRFVKTDDRDNEVIRAEYSTNQMPGAPMIVVLND